VARQAPTGKRYKDKNVAAETAEYLLLSTINGIRRRNLETVAHNGLSVTDDNSGFNIL
jgi:hypothetical protein